MKAVAYIRTSTKKQDNSLTIQDDVITSFAKDKFELVQKALEAAE